MIKVLHILSQVNPGGIENWLLSLCDESDDRRIKNEILIQKNVFGSLAASFNEIGVKLHVVPDNENIIQRALLVYKIYKKGKYNAVHSHVHHSSGFFLFIAWLAGIKNRLAHCHSNRQKTSYEKGVVRKFYLLLMKKNIRLFSTKCFAVSYGAAESLYGRDWKKNKKIKIMYCGVKVKKTSGCGLEIKNKSSDDVFIGHAGRFCEAKNHDFLIEAFFKAKKINRKLRLILMGDGDLKIKMEQKVKSLAVEDDVIFTGFTRNVTEILSNYIDCFAFPSIYEGLPLSVVEAQLVGLKVVISKNITDEVIISSIAKQIDLQDFNGWVDELTRIKKRNKLEYPIVDGRKFSISNNTHELLIAYTENKS